MRQNTSAPLRTIRFVAYTAVAVALFTVGAASLRAGWEYTPYQTASPHVEAQSMGAWVNSILTLADTTVYACSVPCDGTEPKPDAYCGPTCNCTRYVCEETGKRGKYCTYGTVLPPCNQGGPIQCPLPCTNAQNTSCDAGGWV